MLNRWNSPPNLWAYMVCHITALFGYRDTHAFLVTTQNKNQQTFFQHCQWLEVVHSMVGCMCWQVFASPSYIIIFRSIYINLLFFLGFERSFFKGWLVGWLLMLISSEGLGGVMAVVAVSGSVVFIAMHMHKRLLSQFMKKIESELGPYSHFFFFKKKKWFEAFFLLLINCCEKEFFDTICILN